MKRMHRILRNPQGIVFLAWSITFAFFFLTRLLIGSGWLADMRWNEGIAFPYFAFPITVLVYHVSLQVFLAAIATSLSLALGMLVPSVKNFLSAMLTASPGILFLFYAFAVIVLAGKFLELRPIEASMLFFLFFAPCLPVLVLLCKDERKRQKIFQGTLLSMIVIVFLAIAYYLLFRNPTLYP